MYGDKALAQSHGEPSEEPMGSSFRDLIAWQRAVEMCVAIYAASSSFPPAERFGLTSQIRRAAISVPSNIAEGYGKGSRAEYVQYLYHARGSNSEVETQIVIARKLQLGRTEQLESAEQFCTEVGKLIGALLRSLTTKSRF